MLLLERDGQLDRLDALLTACAAGQGRVVLLSGEAGAGKTTLVNAFASRAGARARILRSACEDLSIADPLGPLYDLARHAAWDLSRVERDAPRLPLFSQALSVFDRQDRPTVLVIEDLHWADDATLDFVRFVGRRIAQTRLLLLLTGRNEASDGQRRMRRALVEIPSDLVARIDVPLLSEAAVGVLARGAGRAAADIYRASAGNAFFVTELLQAGDGESVPSTVRDAVLARSERLSAGARAALDLVSVFPRRAETGVLHAILGAAGPEHLAECVAAGMLVALDGYHAFRHEIARRAVELALAGDARRSLNGRALVGLRAVAGVPAVRLVHHAIAAQDLASVAALAPAAAADAARFGAHHEAAGLLRAALQAVPEADGAVRADLLERLAFEMYLIGRMPDALEAEREACRIHASSGDLIRQGNGLRWLSRFSYLDGDRQAAEAFGQVAARLLEAEAPGVELAMAWSNLSQLAMLADRPAEAIREGERTLALVEGLDRSDIVCHALNNIGTAMQWTAPAEALERLSKSLRMALDAGFEEHAARAYTNLACAAMNLPDLGRADKVLREGIEYCIERDLDTWRDYMRGWQADLLLRRGLWDDAAHAASMVLDNEHATPLARYPAGVVLARLRLRRGDPTEALLEDVTRFLDRGKELQRLAPYATLMAERAWIAGDDPAAALRLLDEAIALLPTTAIHRDLFFWRDLLGGTTVRPGDDAAPSEDAPFERGLALLAGDEAAQQEALAIFAKLGATAVVQRVKRRLRDKGVTHLPRGPYRRARENVAGLTARQMEVLRLVGRGFSNKAIAHALAISPKTVDHHVSAVLEKLDASSRSEAIAISRDLDLI